ncbi:uncharacterized protein HD556DRAFT_1314605 [Suillus plorans]|uniref:Uncharacterized protein n=1 Tax=Suillus plorans TaxID=116603 RepID=A0A9P7DAU2_9AGAM|nr:uncharacterized protein HD556DRAFT_1314605 [Suillus plorans]KAG1784996.1 hypothetical protein HD556DRAFT_1314605 [Suillus plorans]
MLADFTQNSGLRKGPQAATKALEAECRAAYNKLALEMNAVHELERRLDLMKCWTPGDPEYQEALKYLNNRQFIRVVQHLEGLVVQRLFELTKANLAGTDILKFSEVVSYAWLGKFELLKSSRQEVLTKPWVSKANREVAGKYFRIVCVHEEIECLNVEISHLQSQPALACEIHHLHDKRVHMNNVHHAHLQVIYAMPGFSSVCVLETSNDANEGAVINELQRAAPIEVDEDDISLIHHLSSSISESIYKQASKFMFNSKVTKPLSITTIAQDVFKLVWVTYHGDTGGPLKTVQQKLNHANLNPTMDLLEVIFALSIVDRVRKTVFDRNWQKSPSDLGLTQNNIFQDSSCVSLPFPPLPVAIQNPATAHRNISTTATPATPRPAPTLAEVLQCPDFQTWFLGQQGTHETPSGGPNHSTRIPATASSPHTHWQPTPTRTTPSTHQQPMPAQSNIPAASNPSRITTTRSFDSDSMDVSDSPDSISSESSIRPDIVIALQEALHGQDVVQDSASNLDSEQDTETNDGRRGPMWDQPSFSSAFSVYDNLQHLGAEQHGLPPPYDTVINNQPVVYIQNGIIVRINQRQ